MYTIQLADGRKLEGLGRNGSNYISQNKVDVAIFANNLSTMTIRDEDTGEETVLHDAELIAQQRWPDGWYICFRELSPQEKAFAAIQQALASNADSMTDIQVALAEVYEMILGGGV